jgi:AcrR family transcriptional regulator
VSALQRRTPKAEAHAESQRERILDAAQKCFIEQGFHGASMARIAQEAGISVGLAYRYFDGKNAIMLAIIARELEGKRERIQELCARNDFLDAVLEKFAAWQAGSPDIMNKAIFLEMSAEASRSPEIAQAIRDSDTLVRQEFERWMQLGRREGGLGLTAEEAHERGLFMQCLIEGLVVRAARDPHLDAKAIRRALEPVFRHQGFLPPAPPLSTDPD